MDSQILDSKSQDYKELWAAKRKEYDAKAERLDAESRLKYNDAFENFGEEVEAGADWTEAGFKEFMAKVDKNWQEMAIDVKD